MTIAADQALTTMSDAPSRSIAVPQQLAAVRAVLAPHLDRPGAARLLLLAVDLLLAGGGPCPWSLTDLTHRLGCARKSVLQALRLGEELGLLRGAPGPRIDGRRGPAPMAWSLGPAAEASTGGDTPPIAEANQGAAGHTGSQTTPVTGAGPSQGRPVPATGAPQPALTGAQRQPVSVPLIPASDSPDSLNLVADLIRHAVERTQERQPARLARQVGPVLTGLLRDGWTAADLRELMDDAIAATVAYRPRYPASYLARVIDQRLGRDHEPTDRLLAPAPGRAVERQQAATTTAAERAAAPPTPATNHDAATPPPRRLRRLPIAVTTAALPLPPDILWRTACDELLWRQPREAQYLAGTIGLGCDGARFFVQAPSGWIGDRLEGRLRREIEARLQALAGQPLTVACVAPPVDEPVAVRPAV